MFNLGLTRLRSECYVFQLNYTFRRGLYQKQDRTDVQVGTSYILGPHIITDLTEKKMNAFANIENSQNEIMINVHMFSVLTKLIKVVHNFSDY